MPGVIFDVCDLRKVFLPSGPEAMGAPGGLAVKTTAGVLNLPNTATL